MLGTCSSSIGRQQPRQGCPRPTEAGSAAPPRGLAAVLLLALLLQCCAAASPPCASSPALWRPSGAAEGACTGRRRGLLGRVGPWLCACARVLAWTLAWTHGRAHLHGTRTQMHACTPHTLPALACKHADCLPPFQVRPSVPGARHVQRGAGQVSAAVRGCRLHMKHTKRRACPVEEQHVCCSDARHLPVQNLSKLFEL